MNLIKSKGLLTKFLSLCPELGPKLSKACIEHGMFDEKP